MKLLNTFIHYSQLEEKDCGATCLKIIAKHYNSSDVKYFITSILEHETLSRTSLDRVNNIRA